MIDQHLLTSVQYALLEPPTGGLSWLSELWTTPEMLSALDLRQQRLLKATHLLVGLAEVPATIGQSRYELPDDWLATALVAWADADLLASESVEVDLGGGESAIVSWEDLGATTRVREVFRADMHQADLGDPTWETTPGTPFTYSDADTPTRTIQLMPAPSSAGTIYVLYVPRATAPLGDGEPLQVPDEWCLPVLKYGVLASALGKVGRGSDPQRAAYCEWRSRLGEDVTNLLLAGMG